VQGVLSIRPILIHVNGVEDSVLEERYFDKVIDFNFPGCQTFAFRRNSL
jgi:hypothetical protein